MKNLAISASVLVVIVIAIFLFATKGKNTNDTFIPSPTPVASPSVAIINQNQKANPNTLGNKIYPNPPSPLPQSEIEGKKVVIETEKGQFTIEFSSDTPMASSNFIFLTQEKFYDSLTFHRREEGFVIQGGDPRGDGTGGASYAFADEPVIGDYLRGVVAMANAGPNTNGSQFFIMLKDHLDLPKNYTIFGKVVEGMETVDKITLGDVMKKVTIE